MSGRANRGRLRALVCAAALVLCTMGTAVAHAATATGAFKTPRLYVVNSQAGTLTGVDASSGAVRTRVALSQPRGVGIYPFEVQSSRDGRVVYVLCDGAESYSAQVWAISLDGTATVLDTKTNSVIGTLDAPNSRAIGFGGRTDDAFIGEFSTNTVAVYDAATLKQRATVPCEFRVPAAVTVSPNGETAYVVGGTTLTYVDLATRKATAAVRLSTLGYTTALVLSADGSTAYVDGGTSVAVVDTATGTVTRTLTAGTDLNEGMAVSPDGTTLYTAGGGAYPAPGDLYEVNTASGATTASVAVGTTPDGVVLSADGSQAYVSGSATNTVSVVDTATNTRASTWSFGTGRLGTPIDGLFYSKD